MKKLLSIIGAIGLGASAPAPLLANNNYTTIRKEENSSFEFQQDSPIYLAIKLAYPEINLENIIKNIDFTDYWLGSNIEKLKVAQEYYRVNLEDKADNNQNNIFSWHIKKDETGTVQEHSKIEDIFNSLNINSKSLYEKTNSDSAYLFIWYAKQPYEPPTGATPTNEPIELKQKDKSYYFGIKPVAIKLSSIAIAGIAIGSVAGLAFVVLGSCYLYQYLNKKKKVNTK